MQRRTPAHSSAPKKPEDTKRAVLLSILCSLALILMLALIAWLFYPRSKPQAGADGSGGGTGAGTGTAETAGSGGTGVMPDGDAAGASTGSGSGGDAQGEAKTAGADAAASTGNGASTGTSPAAGIPQGQPDARPSPPSSARASATPPPEPSQTPSKEPQVMSLGNLKFNDKSASTGTGLAAGGPSAPAFFGSRGKGTKFVYIVDRSGSMSGDRFEAARDELKKSLRTLRTGMSFHVIFYDSNHEELPGTPLQPVTVDSITKAIKWIDGQSPRGGTNPEQAMERALELKPHTIWLLTDGEFSERICDKIKVANPAPQISINTICFHDQSGEPLMKRIAAENNGDYRFVPPNSGPLHQPSTPDRKAEWEKIFGKGAKP